MPAKRALNKYAKTINTIRSPVLPDLTDIIAHKPDKAVDLTHSITNTHLYIMLIKGTVSLVL